MKRLHVHVAVENLDHAIGFYSTLFAAEPSVVKPDYAKWMLDDPRVNFAISARAREGGAGIDHLGIQVEDTGELAEVSARLARTQAAVFDQGDTTCCYAKSTKAWITDPAGVDWEAFLTTGESTVYGGTGAVKRPGKEPCCEPAPKARTEQSVAAECCEPTAAAKAKQPAAACCG